MTAENDCFVWVKKCLNCGETTEIGNMCSGCGLLLCKEVSKRLPMTQPTIDRGKV